MFGFSALATPVAGVLIERSGEEFFGRRGLSGVLFGATVLAAATSLHEVSSGLTVVIYLNGIAGPATIAT
ncbi:hypothetical protein [Streptomyces collinus]|uniref:hypothetical protein n=1 Tax=Streptomyces collinus TaxID=42684 RepID=UPI0033D2D4F3